MNFSITEDHSMNKREQALELVDLALSKQHIAERAPIIDRLLEFTTAEFPKITDFGYEVREQIHRILKTDHQVLRENQHSFCDQVFPILIVKLVLQADSKDMFVEMKHCKEMYWFMNYYHPYVSQVFKGP